MELIGIDPMSASSVIIMMFIFTNSEYMVTWYANVCIKMVKIVNYNLLL